MKTQTTKKRSVNNNPAMITSLSNQQQRVKIRQLRKMSTVQAKLKIGEPNDRYEQEADRIADQVMRKSQPKGDADIQPSCFECDEELQRQPMEEEEEEEVIQAKEATTPPNLPTVESGLQSLRGSGQAMSEPGRVFFESHLGADFRNVRIHQGPQAAQLARAAGARAFTHGRDIVFADGEYVPQTQAGKRLLAHELVHVIQQAGTAPQGVIQRTPGENPVESWRALVTTVVNPREQGRIDRARESIRRMLSTHNGRELMNELWRMFCNLRRCRTSITASFLDDREGGWDEAAGYFGPEEPGASACNTDVRNRFPRARDPGRRVIDFGGEWGDISWTHTDPESDMANTLYHEMLHVWFVNSHPRLQSQLPPHPLRTGHDAPSVVHEDFESRYRTFVGQLSGLERRLRRRAEEQRRRQEEAERRTSPTPSPESRREQPPSPAERRPVLGGEAALHGGGVAGGPLAGSGVAILGADLILERIAGLRVGARGVYLTPDHLMAGGSLGYRWVQPEGEREQVRNPLFFDIEAGVLAELTPEESARISDGVVIMGSAGIGQEIGRRGPRFFWRVGGMVIITDRGEAAGGGTAGIGVRY